MKELSLNILDIAQNSIRARATEVEITLQESRETLIITVSDNGCGMKKEFLLRVTDPFRPHAQRAVSDSVFRF